MGPGSALRAVRDDRFGWLSKHHSRREQDGASMRSNRPKGLSVVLKSK